MTKKTKVKFTNKKATFIKAHETDSGLDLTGVGYKYKKNGLWVVDLGLQVKPPEGHYYELSPRSSFSETPFSLANSLGIIDQDFIGNWKFPVRHLSFPWWDDQVQDMERTKLFVNLEIEKYLIYNRIAQAVLKKRYDSEIEIFTGKWEQTERGAGGFGSSGK